MLHILYFAWLRERMGIAEEHLPRPQGVETVEQLASFLIARNAQGARAFADPAQVRAAINQDFARPSAPIVDGDEIAFFPPVTGG